MASMNCTSCGAPIDIKNQFIRTATCEYCGAVFTISGSEDLKATGDKVSLADYPSRFSIGTRGKIKDKGFSIIGRMRYTYEEGFWDEWQIIWDDDSPPSWLEEDEGYWTLYDKERVRGAIASYDEIKVGASVKINKHEVFITERRKGKLLGHEGQFASTLPNVHQFSYVQGAADDLTVSVTYWKDSIEISVGEELEPNQVKFT